MQSSDNAFHALYKLVTEVFKDFAPPKCSLQLFKPDETCEESTTHQGKTISTNSDSNSNITNPEKPVIAFTDVYRYRSSRKERAFVPPTTNKNSQVSQTTSDTGLTVYNNELDYANNTNFISISKDEQEISICEKEESKSRNTGENKDKSSLNESKLISNSTDLSKHAEDCIPRKRKNSATYLSLKVKCIQGNSNRIKATKIKKKKK